MNCHGLWISKLQHGRANIIVHLFRKGHFMCTTNTLQCFHVIVNRGSEFEKTEIRWEDNWLDFINETLEFAVGHLDTALLGVTLHKQLHETEAKGCPSFLTVVEKNTGKSAI